MVINVNSELSMHMDMYCRMQL